MSHNRKLGKPTDQRIAMLRAMTTYLLENGRSRPPMPVPRKLLPWPRR